MQGSPIIGYTIEYYGKEGKRVEYSSPSRVFEELYKEYYKKHLSGEILYFKITAHSIPIGYSGSIGYNT